TLTPLSPRRYKLQLTISGETLEKLRRAKDMLGHAVASGDDDAVLNRALTVLLDKLAREKYAQTDKPRPGRPRSPRARRPSAAVMRILWKRDEGRCKYIAPDGHRCEETRRVQPHHLDPWVLAGSSNNPDDYELRCSSHNDYEGRLCFGRRRRKGKNAGDGTDEVRECAAPYGARSFSAELVPEQTATPATGARPKTAWGPARPGRPRTPRTPRAARRGSGARAAARPRRPAARRGSARTSLQSCGRACVRGRPRPSRGAPRGAARAAGSRGEPAPCRSGTNRCRTPAAPARCRG